MEILWFRVCLSVCFHVVIVYPYSSGEVSCLVLLKSIASYCCELKWSCFLIIRLLWRTLVSISTTIQRYSRAAVTFITCPPPIHPSIETVLYSRSIKLLSHYQHGGTHYEWTNYKCTSLRPIQFHSMPPGTSISYHPSAEGRAWGDTVASIWMGNHLRFIC